MLPFLGRLEEIASFFLKLILFGFAEYKRRPLSLLASILTFRQFSYRGDVFFGGHIRSKEVGRIYAHWHYFCNHGLLFHKYLSDLLFKNYVNQKTKNSIDYHWNIPSSMKKCNSMMPGHSLLFYGNTIVL